MNHTFKIGDRVRCTARKNGGLNLHNKTGTILNITNHITNHSAFVEFDERLHTYFTPGGKRGHGWNVPTMFLEPVNKILTVKDWMNIKK